MTWLTSRFEIDLSRPRVMGIVNVTPDSFSDPGRHGEVGAALAHVQRLVEEGADLLDIGGESTRPGSRRPSAQEELARVLPVLRHAVGLGVPVSVDTSRAEVMRAALDLGVDVINDVRALREPGALDAVANHPRAGVCLMHMQGEPSSMQAQPSYVDVVREVRTFLEARSAALRERGVDHARIAWDPGIGFGKTPAHNVEISQRLSELAASGFPLLLGWSRKSTLGVLTGRAVQDRLAGSVAAALASAAAGARILRVHDVAATVDALKVWLALRPTANQCGDNGREQGALQP